MGAAYLRGPSVAPIPERYSGCVGKHPFPDPAIAREVMATSRESSLLCVYRCLRCRAWHIGNHRDASPARARAALVRPE